MEVMTYMIGNDAKEIKKSGFNFIQHPVLDGIPDSNFWQYSLQLNLYKFILEKNYGIRIDNLYLVAIHLIFKNISNIRHQICKMRLLSFLSMKKC